MAVSYKKLWHLLLDRDMKKIELEKKAGITHYQMYKLANNMDVTTDVLRSICIALDCRLEEIIEFVPDQKLRGVNNG